MIEALVAFIEKRLAEDQQTARWVLDYSSELAEMGRWEDWEVIRDVNNHVPPFHDDYVIRTKLGGLRQHEKLRLSRGGAFDRPLAEHLARFGSPARVLREVEAKRAILGQYEAVCAEVREPKSADHLAHARSRQFQLDQVLPLLALPYVAHPGYDPAWAPDVGR